VALNDPRAPPATVSHRGSGRRGTIRGSGSRSVDWFGLFLRLDGRIGRRAFWLGFVVVVAALFVADLLVRALGVADAVAITLLVELGYPLVAILVKRLHDRGRSGWWAALLAAPLGAALVAALAARLAG